jgi:hypothetical protein
MLYALLRDIMTTEKRVSELTDAQIEELFHAHATVRVELPSNLWTRRPSFTGRFYGRYCWNTDTSFSVLVGNSIADAYFVFAQIED